MSAYALFLALVLAVCALGAIWALWEAIDAWSTRRVDRMVAEWEAHEQARAERDARANVFAAYIRAHLDAQADAAWALHCEEALCLVRDARRFDTTAAEIAALPESEDHR